MNHLVALALMVFVSASSLAWAGGNPLMSKKVTCTSTRGELQLLSHTEFGTSFGVTLKNGIKIGALVVFEGTLDHMVKSKEHGTILSQAWVQLPNQDPKKIKRDQAQAELFYHPATYDKMFPTWMNGSRSETQQLVYLWSSTGIDVSCDISRL